jgi:hypothetical protein
MKNQNLCNRLRTLHLMYDFEPCKCKISRLTELISILKSHSFESSLQFYEKKNTLRPFSDTYLNLSSLSLAPCGCLKWHT